MKIEIVNTKKQKKEYIDFIYKVYKDDKNYTDMNIIFVKNFLYAQDKYAKRVEVIPFLIRKDNEIKLEGMYIIDDSNEIKLSFLEFLPKASTYLKEVVKYSKELLEKYNKDKVIVGLNGQVSYGLGILTSEYNRNFEFNANYNPDYYTKEMDKAFPVIKKAFSYIYKATNSLSLFDKNMLDHVYSEYEFRFLDKKHFKKDMLTFGYLCHKSLKGTPYYSKKKPEEMYELMKKMKLIMRKEDIIFAMKDGKEIGFVYTHPDYAELFDKPRMNYIKFYLRFLFKPTKNVIYNVIGVLPEYQKSGVAINLIHKSIVVREPKYPYGVSSFILEDNIPSTMLCRKLSVGINKEYHLYEIGRNKNV